MAKEQEVTISNWGNSLGLRIPKKFADELELSHNSKVILRKTDNGIEMIPVNKRIEYTLEELLEEIEIPRKEDVHE